jgi:hypothetical protein
MAKIGRNEPCPCGSGKKYKHCCLPLDQAGRTVSPMARMKVSLLAEIEKIQRAAADKKSRLRELGVFIFFSMENGDAWVLEVSDSDAVQVAEAGKALAPPVAENPETIEINWSHTFVLQDRQLFLTAYADKAEAELAGAPTQQINAAIRRIMKRYSPELLNQVHVRSEEDAQL